MGANKQKFLDAARMASEHVRTLGVQAGNLPDALQPIDFPKPAYNERPALQGERIKRSKEKIAACQETRKALEHSIKVLTDEKADAHNAGKKERADELMKMILTTREELSRVQKRLKYLQDKETSNIDGHYKDIAKTVFLAAEKLNAAAKVEGRVESHPMRGNCDEQSCLAFIWLREHGYLPLDLMFTSSFGGGDAHQFVVIGRGKDDHLDFPENWHEDACICDPWSKEQYYAAERLVDIVESYKYVSQFQVRLRKENPPKSK